MMLTIAPNVSKLPRAPPRVKGPTTTCTREGEGRRCSEAVTRAWCGNQYRLRLKQALDAHRNKQEKEAERALVGVGVGMGAQLVDHVWHLHIVGPSYPAHNTPPTHLQHGACGGAQ
jgi:hypothetical protein